ncbi:MAG: anthranilate phosphoribosyltransferase [Planctomycetota bacterium]|nr:anthranilate phosphoribosyltransferase [Planctomycetota bacterium]
MTSVSFPELLNQLCLGQSLTAEQCAYQFNKIMNGDCSEIELTAFLIALKSKGESPDEIAGAARAMRDAATPFPKRDYPTVDSCGTGGDGQHTVNVSTAVAMIAAEAGLYVTKHGNRSISSKCGSADVLEQCGIKLDASVNVAQQCLDAERFCFLFAPTYHSGMRHAMPTRRALKTRTLFNLLGPLVNPSRPERQVLGVYDPNLCLPIAKTLKMLGTKAALVVHGGGMDEIAIHSSTHGVLLKDGVISELILSPKDVGLSEFPIESLRGGEPEENAEWFRGILAGQGSDAHKAAVSMNAGALLWIANQSETWKDGVEQARSVIDSGLAAERLKRVGALSHGS